MKARFRCNGIVMAAIAVVILAIPMLAFAARPYSSSIVYLDSHDNIIGQQVAFCNNVQKHAGQINPSNPYRVVLSGRCPGATYGCHKNNGHPCPINQFGTPPRPEYFRSATGKTVDFFCWANHPVNTPFHGANHQCGYLRNWRPPEPGNPEPHLVTTLTNWQSGWN